MAPYKILKQGYMMKEPPISKRGIRKVLDLGVVAIGQL
jgi:hypothetical protein